jgi:hypothetical protein
MGEETPKSKSISIFYILLGIILIIEFLYSFIFTINPTATNPPNNGEVLSGVIFNFLSFGLPLLFSGLCFLFFGLGIFERNKKSNTSKIIFIGISAGFLFIFFLALTYYAMLLIVPIIIIITYIAVLVGLIYLLTSVGSLKRIICLIIISFLVTIIFTWSFNSLRCSLKNTQGDKDSCFQNFALNTQTLDPCSKISSGDARDYCYLNLATGTGPSRWDGTKVVKEYSPLSEKISKEEICSYIASDITKQKCLH